MINNNTLAGSVVNMLDTFKNLIKINFSIEQAVAMTSFNAAQYLCENNIGNKDKTRSIQMEGPELFRHAVTNLSKPNEKSTCFF